MNSFKTFKYRIRFDFDKFNRNMIFEDIIRLLSYRYSYEYYSMLRLVVKKVV